MNPDNVLVVEETVYIKEFYCPMFSVKLGYHLRIVYEDVMLEYHCKMIGKSGANLLSLFMYLAIYIF